MYDNSLSLIFKTRHLKMSCFNVSAPKFPNIVLGACLYVCVCMCACIHACVCVCVYVRMYVVHP